MLDRSALVDPIGALGGSGEIYTAAETRPQLSGDRLMQATPDELLAFYAPIYVQQYAEVSSEGFHYEHDSDLFGQPFLVGNSRGGMETKIDVSQPSVYSHYDRRQIGSQSHVQLTYTLWYPRHPRTRRIDIEPGVIDSNVVRITLDERNKPLIYETVLACGCYHKVFVEQRLEEASRASFGPPEHGKKYSIEKNISFGFDFEVAGIVETPDDSPAAPVVFISSGEHKVQGLHSSAGLHWPTDTAAVHKYRLADYEELNSVPIAGSQSSGPVFNGLDDQQVYGAERMERFLFMWIGTDDAGHPRRNDRILLHFDQSAWMDPNLFHHYLRLPPGF